MPYDRIVDELEKQFQNGEISQEEFDESMSSIWAEFREVSQ